VNKAQESKIFQWLVYQRLQRRSTTFWSVFDQEMRERPQGGELLGNNRLGGFRINYLDKHKENALYKHGNTNMFLDAIID
jgi:hypothetical protein